MSYRRPGYCNLCEREVPVAEGLCKTCIDELEEGLKAPTTLKVNGKQFYCTNMQPSALSLTGGMVKCGCGVFHKELVQVNGNPVMAFVCNACDAAYASD